MTPAMAVLKDWRSPPSTYWTFPYSDLKVGLNPHPVIANRAKFLGNAIARQELLGKCLYRIAVLPGEERCKSSNQYNQYSLYG